MRGRVIIPQSQLGQQLAEAAARQAELTRLLDELERAGGRPTSRPLGAWRHDPLGWPRHD